jgi:hypothetical protein
MPEALSAEVRGPFRHAIHSTSSNMCSVSPVVMVHTAQAVRKVN